ncbi:MAG: glycosyltransferase [Gammaproteobacteria bacterium]
MLTLCAFAAAVMWVGLLLLPWQPWSTRESLHAAPGDAASDFGDITALIPARDEAGCIADTLRALAAQGRLARIVLIDDQSSDGTGDIARALGIENLEVVAGSNPPPGWSGKLWALHQGLEQVSSSRVLLLDADIQLAPGALAALATRMASEGLTLASVMATLHMGNAWEKLLLPPFIFFFKLIYPFALANRPGSRIAAAAGGCILLETAALRGIGGFAALHDAIIDDCTLARRIKQAGGTTWLGLSRDVCAIRPYETLDNIWNMVARSAFTQLRYSTPLLVLCTVLLLVSFVAPVLGVLRGGPVGFLAGLVALGAMARAYLPTVRYYALHGAWTATLPLAACLFLAMTWHSAIRYWSGERSRWKNRSYERAPGDGR